MAENAPTREPDPSVQAAIDRLLESGLPMHADTRLLLTMAREAQRTGGFPDLHILNPAAVGTYHSA